MSQRISCREPPSLSFLKKGNTTTYPAQKWREHYLNYQKLKKVLKDIKDRKKKEKGKKKERDKSDKLQGSNSASPAAGDPGAVAVSMTDAAGQKITLFSAARGSAEDAAAKLKGGGAAAAKVVTDTAKGWLGLASGSTVAADLEATGGLLTGLPVLGPELAAASDELLLALELKKELD